MPGTQCSQGTSTYYSCPQEAFFPVSVSVVWDGHPAHCSLELQCDASVSAEKEGLWLDCGRVYTKPGPYVVWLRDSREGALYLWSYTLSLLLSHTTLATLTSLLVKCTRHVSTSGPLHWLSPPLVTPSPYISASFILPPP